MRNMLFISDVFCVCVEINVIVLSFSYCARSSARIIPIQRQVSVESLTNSLADLQPAAPDVVLPIEQSQTVSDQPSERSEDNGDTVCQIQKDGHYFLKVRSLFSQRFGMLSLFCCVYK
jgi:hypothetical protein